MAFIDLHVHSDHSDGSLSPSQLVRYACEKGLNSFALTDHDTVSGIDEALIEARNHPVSVIPGIEVSSFLSERSIHILGYYIDYHHPVLLRSLASILRYREERNMKICAQLRAYGVDIDYETLKLYAGCRMITRFHFAEYLLENGYVKDMKDAFEKYLSKGRPCYIPMKRLSTRDAVKLILIAGGVPVLAHPVHYKMTDKGYLQLFQLVKTFGVKGVEAIYSANSMDDEIKFRELSKICGMFITGGTDFHGRLKPDIDMGTGKGNLMISSELLKNII